MPLTVTLPAGSDANSLTTGTYNFVYHGVMDFSVVPNIVTPFEVPLFNGVTILNVVKNPIQHYLLVSVKGTIGDAQLLSQAMLELLHLNNQSVTVEVQAVVNDFLAGAFLLVILLVAFLAVKAFKK